MWAGRCSYISRLKPATEFKPDRPIHIDPKCADYLVGTDRYSDEFWVVSLPSAVITDVLPLTSEYVWGNKGAPNVSSWEPEFARFPRPGLTAVRLLNEDSYLYALDCSKPSIRRHQYITAYGRGVMERLPADSYYCRWLELSTGFGDINLPFSNQDPIVAFLSDAARPETKLSCQA